LIDRHYDEQGPRSAPDATVSSLSEAVSWILGRVPFYREQFA
jgi:hypothetical protein